MKKKYLRIALIAALSIGLIIGVGGIVRKQIDYKSGAEDYSEAETLAGFELPNQSEVAAYEAAMEADDAAGSEQPDGSTPSQDALLHRPSDDAAQAPLDPYAAALMEIDLASLQAVNDDVIGWILVPGTSISYPLMQGEDNDYYLHYTWQKTWNSLGSIFLDCRSSDDLSDFHSIIYGHRMTNDTMFAPLHKYKEDGFLEANPTIYIVDKDGVRLYDVFAAYETGTGNTYTPSFADDAAKQSWLDECLSQNMLDAGIVPETDDRIITLSTCTGTGRATRWVVQAVLRTEQTLPGAGGQTESAS